VGTVIGAAPGFQLKTVFLGGAPLCGKNMNRMLAAKELGIKTPEKSR
jgi:hypothetical protein